MKYSGWNFASSNPSDEGGNGAKFDCLLVVFDGDDDEDDFSALSVFVFARAATYEKVEYD